MPAFFISKVTVWPAGQAKVEITWFVPGATVITPRFFMTEGALLKVVEL